jgi:hypothetical protein
MKRRIVLWIASHTSQNSRLHDWALNWLYPADAIISFKSQS